MAGLNDMPKAIMEAAKFPARVVKYSKEWIPDHPKNKSNGVENDIIKYIKNPTQPGLVVCGRMSSGKTILLGRIALELVDKYSKGLEEEYENGGSPDAPFYYIQSHQLSQILNNEWESINRKAFIDLVNVSVLFIDDFDKAIGSFLTKKGQGVFEMLLKERDDINNLTFLTSNTPVEDLECSEYLVSFINKYKQIEIYGSFIEEED